MSRFNHYFQMNVDDVIEYTLEKAGEIPWDRDSMEAIVPSSHGNLNYVYQKNRTRRLSAAASQGCKALDEKIKGKGDAENVEREKCIR